MAQYTYYTDPITGLKVRDGVRNNGSEVQYVIDKELEVDGFSGAENVNWENIEGAV